MPSLVPGRFPDLFEVKWLRILCRCKANENTKGGRYQDGIKSDIMDE
jgi:hypothetical protein